jgi:hypothetical protein
MAGRRPVRLETVYSAPWDLVDALVLTTRERITMRLPRFICCWIPYYKHSLRRIGKGLYKEGYKENRSSRGIAWGFGHPTFYIEDFEDKDGFTSVCTRCGSRKEHPFDDV